MAELQALLFDQDGVLADTERDGHRVSFNRAFAEFNLPFEWDVDVYGDLLAVGGGKERVRYYLNDTGRMGSLTSPEELIQNLHKRKTELFKEIIHNGDIALRPGVKRLIEEAHEAGLKLAVCSTSNVHAVHTLVQTLLGEYIYNSFNAILAGDMVMKKKPDPEIYIMASQKLAIAPENCLVVEDTGIGLQAAKRAGMHCLITVNGYTHMQDFSAAELVVSCLGDAEGERAEVLAGTQKNNTVCNGLVTLETLRKIVEPKLGQRVIFCNGRP